MLFITVLAILSACNDENQSLSLQLENTTDKICNSIVIIPDFGFGNFGDTIVQNTSISSGATEDFSLSVDLPKSDGSLIIYAILRESDTLKGNLGYFTNGSILSEKFNIILKDSELEVLR